MSSYNLLDCQGIHKPNAETFETMPIHSDCSRLALVMHCHNVA